MRFRLDVGAKQPWLRFVGEIIEHFEILPHPGKGIAEHVDIDDPVPIIVAVGQAGDDIRDVAAIDGADGRN